MINGRVEQVRDTVMGLRPIYTEWGNVTELWLTSGDKLVDRRGVKSVVIALARSYALDLRAQRQQLGQFLQRSGVLPFYLGSRVFVPLKMRKALTANDMVYGYLDSEYIVDIKGGKYRGCLASLSTGDNLQILSSQATAYQSWSLGLSLRRNLQGDKAIHEDEELIAESVLILCRNLREIAKRLERIEEHIAEAELSYETGN